MDPDSVERAKIDKVPVVDAIVAEQVMLEKLFAAGFRRAADLLVTGIG